MKTISLFFIVIALSLQNLQAKDHLVLQSGEKVYGYLQGVDGGYISLSDEENNWQSLRRYHPEKIAAFRFADQAHVADAEKHMRASDFESGLEQIRAPLQRWLPYLEFLGVEQQFHYMLFIDALVETGELTEAHRFLKKWKHHFKDAENRETLRILNMRLAWQRTHYPEAALYAEQAIELGDRANRNPSAWAILAHSKTLTKDFEEALWFSLQPICYGATDSALDLDLCYAVAINTYMQLEAFEHAEQLATEMDARQIPWPQSLPRLEKELPKATTHFTLPDPRPRKSMLTTLDQIKKSTDKL